MISILHNTRHCTATRLAIHPRSTRSWSSSANHPFGGGTPVLLKATWSAKHLPQSHILQNVGAPVLRMCVRLLLLHGRWMPPRLYVTKNSCRRRKFSRNSELKVRPQPTATCQKKKRLSGRRGSDRPQRKAFINVYLVQHCNKSRI